MFARVLMAVACLLAAVHTQEMVDESYPQPEWVFCQSTKGSFRIRLYPEWAPNGVARFLGMVEGGFFNEPVAFFRVVKNFVAQFGVGATPNITQAWQAKGQLTDDPNLGIAWKRGMLSFAGSGPNTRTTQLFFGLTDSETLGKEAWETPLGFVDKNFDVVESLFSGYGDLQALGGEGPDTQRLNREGNAYLKKNFPKLDYINSCMRMAPPPPTPRPMPRARPGAPAPTAPTKPVPASNTLSCDKSSCGTVFASDRAGLDVICSCTMDCVDKGNCCEAFQAMCPSQYADAVQSDRMRGLKCTAASCGGALAGDAAGTEILCSCHRMCKANNNCCGGFAEVCTEEMKLLTQETQQRNVCRRAMQAELNEQCDMKKEAWTGFVAQDNACKKVTTCKKQPGAVQTFNKMGPCRRFLKRCRQL